MINCLKCPWQHEETSTRVDWGYRGKESWLNEVKGTMEGEKHEKVKRAVICGKDSIEEQAKKMANKEECGGLGRDFLSGKIITCLYNGNKQ